jgi:hypothetical protein
MSNLARLWLVGSVVVLRGKLFTLPGRGRYRYVGKHRLAG